MNQKDDVSRLTQLGSKETEYKLIGAHQEILECFPNPAPEADYEIVHEFEEFTSLCPKTGQPDFAHVIINYIADQKCIETKSLKLYYFAFRQEGAFMERLTNRIADDLIAVMQPRRLRVEMVFRPRGGIRTSCVREHIKPYDCFAEGPDEEYESAHQDGKPDIPGCPD